MIFSLLMIALVGVVAFFHYVQGFFSAFLSLVICAIAAVVAVGFHEQVVALVAGGKMADYAHAGIICALFGLTYLILRLAFDSMVPGNVNFGSLPDKVGAGVCGLFAGLFVAGIVALAAQAMPFGPSIAGYSRWESRTVKMELMDRPDWSRVGREDITNLLYFNDEVKDARLKGSGSGMLIPADDFVLGFTSRVSNGSLSGDTAWSDVHPSYADELFTQRLGLQPGAKHTAFPQNKVSQVEVPAIFKGKAKGYDQIDGDTKVFRGGKEEPSTKLVAEEGKSLVVLRVMIKRDAADTDGKVRFSYSSIRLCAGGKNYFPVAVLRDDNTAIFHRADDFLFMDGDRGIDAVFEVDNDAFYAKDAGPDVAEPKVAPGAFVEFKRLSRDSIAGKEVKADTAYEIDPKTSDSLYKRVGWGSAAK